MNSVATPGLKPAASQSMAMRPGVFLELRGVLVAGGQRMPVGDEEVAFVLILQLDPILERAVIVAEMQLTGRAHAGQHASVLYRAAHAASPIRSVDHVADDPIRRIEQPAEHAQHR